MQFLNSLAKPVKAFGNVIDQLSRSVEIANDSYERRTIAHTDYTVLKYRNKAMDEGKQIISKAHKFTDADRALLNNMLKKESTF